MKLPGMATLSLRFLLFVLASCGLAANAQRTDSLYAVLDTATSHYRVKTLNELFRAHLPSDPLKAVGYAREALSYATEVNDRKGLGAAYNNLGVAYRTHGALDKSLEYYINALGIYESLENKEGIATTKNNIATIYSIKKDYTQSMKYFEESNKVFHEINDKQKIIGSLNNIGNLYSEMLMFGKAMEYYTEAFDLGAKEGFEYGDPLNNIGNLYFRQNEYAKAVSYYEKALQIERHSDDKTSLLNVLTNLGVAHTRLKHTEAAQGYLDEAFALCNRIQAFSFLPALYKAQAENFYRQGKFREAYETQLKFDEARELVYGEESTRNIAQMELRLSFQEKEKELELLKQEDEIKTLELRNSRLVIVMIILGGMVVIGTLNYVFLSKKKIIKKRPSRANPV
jgi:tetratricopeptide (TPR) repeat protein